jgi:hypothetical protein
LGGVVLVTVIGIYIALGSLNDPSTQIEDAGKNISDNNGGAEAESGSADTSSAANPFGERVKTPLSEKHIQQYIHAMSHQKIEAVEKWSFFRITEERIDFLLEQLEVNNYKNGNLYREILISWKEGDFSEAASQHNTIWDLQDGSIGKATGNLSPKAEEAYLQKQNKESR